LTSRFLFLRDLPFVRFDLRSSVCSLLRFVCNPSNMPPHTLQAQTCALRKNSNRIILRAWKTHRK
jgi:hypothetical protein